MLEQIFWSKIGQGIEVVNDFRYLGGHLSTIANLKTSTLTKRVQQALQQLKRLRTRPATPIAKARAIIYKIYAGAFYGIEASSITTAELNTLVAAVINVFCAKNDTHRADWFFTTSATNNQDLDPYSQVFVRRVMQMMQTIAKAYGNTHFIKHNLSRYAHQKSGPPTWYHGGPDPLRPQSYPAPGTRRGENINPDKRDTTA